jgi:hypothetical protein
VSGSASTRVSAPCKIRVRLTKEPAK